jgi:cobalt-zinc-cadmium efflux system outer membrane protein
MFAKRRRLFLSVLAAIAFNVGEAPHVRISEAAMNLSETNVQEKALSKVPSSGPKDPTGTITLSDAVSLALLNNPELKAFSLEVRVLEAQTLQAGLLPNPEIDTELENFMGSGEFDAFDSVETTIQLSQLIELGGKRSKRKRVSSLERDLAEWDYLTKRADVLTEVTKAFIEVLAAQEHLSLSE